MRGIVTVVIWPSQAAKTGAGNTPLNSHCVANLLDHPQDAGPWPLQTPFRPGTAAAAEVRSTAFLKSAACMAIRGRSPFPFAYGQASSAGTSRQAKNSSLAFLKACGSRCVRASG